MDEDARSHWEQVADQCFDRAYQSAMRRVTRKADNEQSQSPIDESAVHTECDPRLDT
jgi:hypothetical protein